MRTMFAYFTPTEASGEARTAIAACVRAFQFAAALWIVLGLMLVVFTSNVAMSAEAHQRLWTVKLLCFFISCTMHSVLIPLRQILTANK